MQRDDEQQNAEQSKRWRARARDGRCPTCDKRELVAGPKGGASRNVYCPSCRTGWNFHGVSLGVIVKVEPLGPVSLNTIVWARRTYPDEQPWRLPGAADSETLQGED